MLWSLPDPHHSKLRVAEQAREVRRSPTNSGKDGLGAPLYVEDMMKPKHYLITLSLEPQQPVHMHCYIISEHWDAVAIASKQMMDQAELRGVDVLCPLFLATSLFGRSVKTAQKLLSSIDPDAAKCIAAATNRHLSIIATPIGSSLDEDLSALH